MKKTLSIFLAAALLIPLSFSQASAGKGKNHLMEGILIGTGVAILGATIVHEIHHDSKKMEYPCDYPKPDKSYPNKKWHGANLHHDPGHWILTKVWVPPQYGKRWNPGHYNKQGRWVPGRYEQVIVQKGHWEKRNIWVAMNR